MKNNINIEKLNNNFTLYILSFNSRRPGIDIDVNWSLTMQYRRLAL